MTKRKVGFIGWRGMVGSVLMGRMLEEKDFEHLESFFFSTSQIGQKAPDYADFETLLDAKNIEDLKNMEIILTCQGGDYTNEIYPQLRAQGWKGFWIDAASALRMDKESCLVLDPVNKGIVQESIHGGVLNYIGANCTVSLMLMALGGLFRANKVEWVSSMTYQAASGAGARNMIELLKQMEVLGSCANGEIDDPAKTILDVDKKVIQTMRSDDFPQENFGAALGGSLIPWIDKAVEDGQTKEEWKGMVETNKILGIPTDKAIAIDGTCVRMGAMRCHSQGFTIKLSDDMPLSEIEAMISQANDWVELVENDKEDTLKRLSPTYATGSLQIPIGRIRKSKIGGHYLNAFSVGDQLLWGAAEPLRRVLNMLLQG